MCCHEPLHEQLVPKWDYRYFTVMKPWAWTTSLTTVTFQIDIFGQTYKFWPPKLHISQHSSSRIPHVELLVTTDARCHQRSYLLLQSAETARRGWVHISHDTPRQARSEHKGRAGFFLRTASTHSLSSWQASVKPSQKYMVITICRVQERGNGLAQPGYNMNLSFLFCFSSCFRSVCFSQMCSAVLVLSITVDHRQREETKACQSVSFSKPTTLMGCQCDPAALFVLHDYCV